MDEFHKKKRNEKLFGAKSENDIKLQLEEINRAAKAAVEVDRIENRNIIYQNNSNRNENNDDRNNVDDRNDINNGNSNNQGQLFGLPPPPPPPPPRHLNDVNNDISSGSSSSSSSNKRGRDEYRADDGEEGGHDMIEENE